MPPSRSRQAFHPHVQSIMDETGECDPTEAVRVKARSIVEQYHGLLGEAPPFNLQALASVRGLRWSDDAPRYSADSEIAPEADGSVILRVNKERPLVRQRFSIGHEIGHTLFPDYDLAVRCRKANSHAWATEDDLLEMLCDVAASEILFPSPWFNTEIESNPLTGEFLAGLATQYQASREATCRKLVECHPDSLAAVFLSWKLKPTEKRLVKQNQNQLPMFADLPFEAPLPMLRVDYAVLNDAFEARCGTHVPKDKSVPSEGVIYAASLSQTVQEGACRIDLGTIRGQFAVVALPIFTHDETLGPNGESSVVAILRPT